jgi:hypothetical protein
MILFYQPVYWRMRQIIVLHAALAHSIRCHGRAHVPMVIRSSSEHSAAAVTVAELNGRKGLRPRMTDVQQCCRLRLRAWIVSMAMKTKRGTTP